MYFNHIKYILIDLKLFKIYLWLNNILKYLIICVCSILAHVPLWDKTPVRCYNSLGEKSRCISPYEWCYMYLGNLGFYAQILVIDQFKI